MSIYKFLTVTVTSVLLTSCGWFAKTVLHDPSAFTKGWVADTYSTSTTVKVSGNTFSFDFPNSSQDDVNTIWKDTKGLKVGSSISMTYEITGKSPVFMSSNDPLGGLPTVGIQLNKGRIYSHTTEVGRIPLRLGKATLTVPLTPDHWSTVDGVACNHDQAHINEFNKAVTTAVQIGVCFGDNQGFAHGAAVKSGSAHFNVLSFSP